MRRIYEWFGGRKAFNGYLALVSIWVMYFLNWKATGVPPEFKIAVGAVLASLGIVATTIAWEDRSNTSTVRRLAESIGGVARGSERPEPGER